MDETKWDTTFLRTLWYQNWRFNGYLYRVRLLKFWYRDRGTFLFTLNWTKLVFVCLMCLWKLKGLCIWQLFIPAMTSFLGQCGDYDEVY